MRSCLLNTSYRSNSSDTETCILYRDGTMKIHEPGPMDGQKLIDEGAYQSWIFGPSLLDENGKAKTSFAIRDYIQESHPRTAIGYYEPGHYCLLAVSYTHLVSASPDSNSSRRGERSYPFISCRSMQGRDMVRLCWKPLFAN